MFILYLSMKHNCILWYILRFMYIISYNFGIYLTCRPMSSPMLLETAPTLRRLMIPAICGRYGFTRGPKEFTTVPKPFNITVVSSEVCSCWISGQLGWGENVVSNPKHRMTMNWWDKGSWQTRVSLASQVTHKHQTDSSNEMVHVLLN